MQKDRHNMQVQPARITALEQQVAVHAKAVELAEKDRMVASARQTARK